MIINELDEFLGTPITLESTITRTVHGPSISEARQFQEIGFDHRMSMDDGQDQNSIQGLIKPGYICFEVRQSDRSYQGPSGKPT